MQNNILSPNLKQEEFLNSANKNVLVSASAGSGKTTVMIKKLVKLVVEEGVDIKSLLVLTFSDASAVEMKQRLFDALISEMAKVNTAMQTEESLELKEKLENKRKQLIDSIENISFMDIGTFHSFFKRIISKYFYELEVDPSFRIVANKEQQIMLNSAINKTFDRYVLNKDLQFFKLQEIFSRNRSSESFKSNILKLYYASKEIVDFDKWCEKTISENFTENLNNSRAVKFIVNHVKDIVLKSKYFLNKAMAEDEKYNLVKTPNYLNSINQLFDTVLNAEEIEEISKLIFSYNYAGKLFFNKKEIDEIHLVDEVKFIVNEIIKKDIKAIKDYLITDNMDDLVLSTIQTKENILKIIEVIASIDKDYSALKSAKSFLDFNDLQLLAYELFKIEKVKNEVKENYKYIFIDEFQDVNVLQFEIVNKITSNNNLHMIGDVKQSIYEFRLASPQIFLDKYNEFLEKPKNNQIVDLNKNYRSSNGILQFVNFIFNEIITKQTVGINYKETSQLECGKEEFINFDEELKSKNIHNTKIVIVKNPKASKDEESETEGEEGFEESDSSGVKLLNSKDIEAEAVVEQIQDVLGKPFYNAKTNKVERVDFKDIAILTRDNSQFVSALYNALLKYKIPCHLTTKADIFSTYEVGVLHNYLKLLNNSTDDYALVSVLKSPIVGLTYNELSKIRLINNNKNTPYYVCFNEYVNAHSSSSVEELNKENDFKLIFNENNSALEKNLNVVQYDEGLRSKLIEFLNKLNNDRKSLLFKSVYDVMVALINRHELFNYFKSMPDGYIKVNNIEEFLNILNTPSFNFNIVECVKYLDELRLNEDYILDIKGGQNAVKLLTMHKSKGLEFPVVILAELGKTFATSKERGDLVTSVGGGIGIKLKDPKTRKEASTLQYNAILIEKLNNQLKEQIRLFYVATTRAKNYLYLVGSFNLDKFDEAHKRSVFAAKNFLEFIFKAVNDADAVGFKNAKDSFVINKNTSSETLINIKTKDSFNFVDEKSIPLQFDNKKVNRALVDKLKEIHKFEYVKEKNVSVKNSVTSLLNEQDYSFKNLQPTNLNINDFDFSYDNELAIEIGNMYHLIMQNVSYNENRAELEKLILNLVSQNRITMEVLDNLNYDYVLNAIDAVKGLIKKDTKIIKEQQFILQDEHKNLVENSNISQKVIVQGVVDLVLINTDKIIIVDFKSNSNTSVEKLLNTYSLQLKIYSRAISVALENENVEKYIYSFSLNELIKV